MTQFKLIIRNLWFYRRTHLGVVAGTCLAAMVLIGALGVGDSVRHSLTLITLSRLGNIHYTIFSAERFLHADLAAKLAAADDFPVAGILQISGIGMTPDETGRIHDVQVIGVSDSFRQFAPGRQFPVLPAAGEAIINHVMAAHLGLEAGDRFVLRIAKPRLLPASIPFATEADKGLARLLTVHSIVGPQQFGNFTLQSTQIVPPTIFVARSWLNEQLGLQQRVNLLLTGAPVENEGQEETAVLRDRLQAQFALTDAGITVEESDRQGVLYLKSERIFLDSRVADSALDLAPDAQGILTYFVNEFSTDERTTPYSFISAPGPPRVPPSLADDQILINSWLAADLQAEPGDQLQLKYYIVAEDQTLREEFTALTVAGILPLAETEEDRELVPHIPGLSDAENCRDWDPGIPIELDRIRPQDEEYWERYGPLPKAYVTLATAQRLWQNRYGQLTSVRFSGTDGEAVRQSLNERLNAADFGITMRNIREQGLRASREGVDFGQLFVGLSFFLIAAAILLTALLFILEIEQRGEESGTYRALGFAPRLVKSIYLREAMVLIIVGVALGAVFAMLYNLVILRALGSIWSDAVRTSAFEIKVKPLTMVAGAFAAAAVAFLALRYAVRRQLHVNIRKLQQNVTDSGLSSRRTTLMFLSASACVLLATAIVLLVDPVSGPTAAAAFFASGALLLSGLLAFWYLFITRIGCVAAESDVTLMLLILRNVSRRRGRSVATVALLACGVFLVTAVAANRRGTVADPAERDSGTGGFALFARSTLPIARDLNTETGQREYGLQDLDWQDVSVVSMLLREEDDASCLNLNRVRSPHLLGVNIDDLHERHAFRFADVLDSVDSLQPWQALEADLGPDIIPGIADQAVIVWGLGKRLGDTLPYSDEQGREFRVKLVAGLSNSILQGHVLISRENFLERFPSTRGSRIFLVDAPIASAPELSRQLTQQLSDVGFAAVPAWRRLAEFNSVENTYLSIFLVLGALGVIVGTAGLGIVVMRNVLERRAELALLRAVGFTRRRILWLIIAEHWLLSLAGVVIGVISALVAVAPALLSANVPFPFFALTVALAGIISSALLWTWLAGHAALHGKLLPALRNE